MQIYEQLKNEYMKSNLLRRKAIYEKYGFNNEEDYLSFLNYQLKKAELKEAIKELKSKQSNI